MKRILFILCIVWLCQSTETFANNKDEVLLAIDNLCGDTVCEGEYDYNFLNLKQYKGHFVLFFTQLSSPEKKMMCEFKGKLNNWLPDKDGNLTQKQEDLFFLCIDEKEN